MNGSIWPAVAVYAVATLLDWRTTRALFDVPGVRELGPLVRRYGPNTVTVLSLVVAVGLICAHAIAMLVVLAALHMIAAANNQRLLRRVR